MKEYPVYIGGFHHFTREQLAKAGVFIAHDFFGDDDTKREGYRNKFNIAFRDTPYMPVYAPIDSGTILETLTQSMVNCFAGIFDVTTSRRLNANVLIELGICLAINHPAIVIAEGADPLPDFLESLRPLRYTGRRDLIGLLSEELYERITESQRLQHSYCVICRRTDCECRTSMPMEDKTYMLLGAHVDADEVDIDVEEALLHFDLKRLQIAATDARNLCAWLRLIKWVRFAFFYSKALGKAHHGDENAATMLQLGLAIGSPTPWRIIVPVDEFPPTDVGAFMAVIRNPNARIFQDRISGAASKLLEEFNPLRVVNGGIGRPNLDEWLVDHSKAMPLVFLLFTEITPLLEQVLNQIRNNNAFIWNDQSLPLDAVGFQDYVTLGVQQSDLTLVALTKDDIPVDIIIEIKKSLRLRKPIIILKLNPQIATEVYRHNLAQFPSVDFGVTEHFDKAFEKFAALIANPTVLWSRQKVSAHIFLQEYVVVIYSEEDSDYAEKLIHLLSKNGVDVWQDYGDVEVAIKSCAAIIIIGSASLQSDIDLNAIIKLAADNSKEIHSLIIDGSDPTLPNATQLENSELPSDDFIAELIARVSYNRSVESDSEYPNDLGKPFGQPDKETSTYDLNTGSRIFIPYARRDDSYDQELVDMLRSRERWVGIDRDLQSTPVGEGDWQTQIRNAIDAIDAYIPLITPAALEKVPAKKPKKSESDNLSLKKTFKSNVQTNSKDPSKQRPLPQKRENRTGKRNKR